jgi:hypothetical protein
LVLAYARTNFGSFQRYVQLPTREERAHPCAPAEVVNADLILPVLADEILPVYRPDSVEANGSDA